MTDFHVAPLDASFGAVVTGLKPGVVESAEGGIVKVGEPESGHHRSKARIQRRNMEICHVFSPSLS